LLIPSADKDNPVTTNWPIDILPLIDRLAQEKPVTHGLAIELPTTPQWPGEWQSITLTELESFAFNKRYDLAVISLQDDYEGNSVLNKSNSATTPSNDGNSGSRISAKVSAEVLSHGITRLRDLLARRVLILAGLQHTSLLRALGFSQIEQLADAPLIIWQFNILSYKQVPDWLNSKYWANPENWGKYRW
jgi:hypothetical protein